MPQYKNTGKRARAKANWAQTTEREESERKERARVLELKRNLHTIAPSGGGGSITPDEEADLHLWIDGFVGVMHRIPTVDEAANHVTMRRLEKLRREDPVAYRVITGKPA